MQQGVISGRTAHNHAFPVRAIGRYGVLAGRQDMLTGRQCLEAHRCNQKRHAMRSWQRDRALATTLADTYRDTAIEPTVDWAPLPMRWPSKQRQWTVRAMHHDRPNDKGGARAPCTADVLPLPQAWMYVTFDTCPGLAGLPVAWPRADMSLKDVSTSPWSQWAEGRQSARDTS